MNVDENSYGPDIFCDYILDFIERKKDVPFFAYYPMVLVHNPFVPTPDSKDWSIKENRYKNDTSHFRDMVAYTDKIVGRIHQKLKDLGIEQNTILIFTGDNGTNTSIVSHTTYDTIRGGKGNTIDAGTRVPLIVHWPEKIKQGHVYDGLVEFSDFFPTLADIAGIPVAVDGKSFFPLLSDSGTFDRKTAFVHYDPRWGKNVNRYRNRFARTLRYKLYQDGKFYDLSDDVLEKHPIDTQGLKPEILQVRDSLQAILDLAPPWE